MPIHGERRAVGRAAGADLPGQGVWRVAASLLTAVGLPELLTDSFEDYEALALRFATDPLLRSELRERLRKNRLECFLFDTDRFCRNIEAAYTTMWELWQRGERPRSFSVPSTE